MTPFTTSVVVPSKKDTRSKTTKSGKLPPSLRSPICPKACKVRFRPKNTSTKSHLVSQVKPYPASHKSPQERYVCNNSFPFAFSSFILHNNSKVRGSKQPRIGEVSKSKKLMIDPMIKKNIPAFFPLV